MCILDINLLLTIALFVAGSQSTRPAHVQLMPRLCSSNSIPAVTECTRNTSNLHLAGSRQIYDEWTTKKVVLLVQQLV